MTGTPRKCVLTFGPVAYSSTEGTTFTTRGYQKQRGFMGGPIIRVKAGETFQIELKNVLTAKDNYEAPPGQMNTPHLPNSTNVHTHGLHISGQSPGDNIFTTVGPRQTATYTYEIPENHGAGTFLYHPHLHGSSSLQFGGGAAGVIIVEDAQNSLPLEVLAMEDVPLLLTHIEPPKMEVLQELYNFDLWQVKSGKEMVLTNGQSSPSKTLVSGTWYRFRILFTSDQNIATVSFSTVSGGATCELELLAKDGIYLTTAPRSITKAYIPPGGRADVAVRCSNSGRVNMIAVTSPAGTAKQSTHVPLQLTIEASSDRAADLSRFKPFRPCYLTDTRTVSPETSLDLTLGTGDPNTKLNGQFFESPDISLNPTSPFITGSLGEVTLLQGTFVHVLHIHVNPFQLTTLSPVIDTNYFQVGDWHDTLDVFLAQPPGSIQTIIRFWVDRYAGHAVVHCHMSTHEDEGMMNTYLISGVEGATVDIAARQVDPLCITELSGQGYTLL